MKMELSERQLTELEAKAGEIGRKLGLMANPKRLMILCILSEGEVCVGQIQKEMSIGQSSLSQHLAKLRDSGMVETRRDAQTIYYRLEDPQIETLMAALYEAFCAPDEEIKEAS